MLLVETAFNDQGKLKVLVRLDPLRSSRQNKRGTTKAKTFFTVELVRRERGKLRYQINKTGRSRIKVSALLAV